LFSLPGTSAVHRPAPARAVSAQAARLTAAARAAHSGAPQVTQIADTRLDPAAIYFVSFDSLVNTTSFQQDAIVSYAGYQYAAWYSADRAAVLGRRRLPVGDWQTLRLPHQLRNDNAHNVISLGISPRDGRLHVAMDTHDTAVYYTVSEPGLVSAPGSRAWTAGRFGPVEQRLGGLDLGPITYPQFIRTPEGRLQLSYRAGAITTAAMELAEYDGSWHKVGGWQSPAGTYPANGVASTGRAMYLYGIGYGRGGRLHAAFTWREADPRVLCAAGGLPNHDVSYVYSDDRGRTWRNGAGAVVGVTGAAQRVSLDSPGLVVDRVGVDRALMNQESQQVDSHGNPHVLISYVPAEADPCVDAYAADRAANAQLFHLYRDDTGAWRKVRIPIPLGATQRSQIVLDAHDNVYVVMPFGRVVTASRKSGWQDWSLRFDGTGLDAFGEPVVDRSRVTTEGVLSVLYQKRSTGTVPSPIRVLDLQLG
jgi:hypothetical protein